ncbi:class A beta-lactamase [Paenibacillus pasadenensis]|uniref:class A beta-lactamase n=1 Tax=Paenibacillus pasadenensis TaxID=217090 RepID=UPI0020425283|nr:class A beta-lactamase [Paenibacillus pasadenensis]MCM3748865.1 class A beta-lactamase [Paenibacillus pasadenensis]
MKRHFIVYLAAFVSLTGCSVNETSTPAPSSALEIEEKQSASENSFELLEADFGARLGVYAIDTATGRAIEYRSDERFAYASTFKAIAAGFVLKQSTGNELDQIIPFTKDDLVSYSPITEKHLSTGLSLRELCEAAVRYSDNTAGNLLFKQLGGPEGYEAALRQNGNTVTQADRFEPDLNKADPGDPRDTSTPRAIATMLSKFAVGDLLSENKRSIWLGWMSGNATGDELIRAGAPADWKVADKSGAASYGTRNDIAVVFPPNGGPIVIAIMSSRDKLDADYDNDLIAQAAKAALDLLI